MGKPVNKGNQINYAKLPQYFVRSKSGDVLNDVHNAVVDLRWKLQKMDSDYRGIPDGVLSKDEIATYMHTSSSSFVARFKSFQKVYQLLQDARRVRNPLLSMAKEKLGRKILALASKVVPSPSLVIESGAKTVLGKLNYGVSVNFASIVLHQLKGGRISEVKKWQFGPIKSCSVSMLSKSIFLFHVKLLDGKRREITYNIKTRKSTILDLRRPDFPILIKDSDPPDIPRRPTVQP